MNSFFWGKPDSAYFETGKHYFARVKYEEDTFNRKE